MLCRNNQITALFTTENKTIRISIDPYPLHQNVVSHLVDSEKYLVDNNLLNNQAIINYYCNFKLCRITFKLI